jgi:hypothetical protein
MNLTKNLTKNLVKDNVFTIKLPASNIVFTRYLYLKDEVKLALLVSLLQKSEDAIFWGYELFHSGFRKEFFDTIWKIYYDFFATLNPSFESYLIKKLNEPIHDKIVSTIIQDLLIRPFNTDIFFMRKVVELFEVESPQSCLKEQLKAWILVSDWRNISYYVLNETNKINPIEVYENILDIFEDIFAMKLTKKRMLKEFLNASSTGINENIRLLAKIMSLFSKQAKLANGKNFYIVVEPEEVIPFETIEISEDIKHYRILKHACLCGIDDLKHLSLFKLERDSLKNIKQTYFDDWLYHASFSPIWFERITKYRGYIDYTSRKIKFIDDEEYDYEDEFYRNFGYEPDEQPLLVQQKCLMNIENVNSWISFYKNYKNNGLIEIDEEELVEFDKEKMIYC